MGGAQRGRSRHARDVLLRRLQDEIEFLFRNEITDERLAGLEMTGIELSPDRRILRVRYLPPEGSEETVAAALGGVATLVEARIAEFLPRPPEVRFGLDRGAANQRRVDRILDELRERGELGPAPEAPDRPTP